MNRGPAAAYLLVTLLGLFVFFFRLGGCGIFDLDEGLYVESAREMRLTGDYVTPRVNGQPFFEKPPLVYWLSAGSMRVLGKTEFAARLPSALASLLTALLILWFGSRVFGRRTGTLAACMFVLSPIVFGEARQLTTDATLNLFLSLALVLLFLIWHDERKQSLRAHTFWAVCALGVLAKGLPGILIPLLTACVFALVDNRWSVRDAVRSLARLRFGTGILLFLVIAAPWHYAAYQASGKAFTDEYIVRQHLARFQGGDTAHRAPFWFYVPGFILGMFPWSFFVPAALLDLRRKRENTVAGQLTEEELLHEQAFADWLEANREEAYAEYRSRFGKVVGSDNVRELYGPYSASRESRTELTQAVDRPSKQFTEYMFRRQLADPGGELVVFTAGGGGSGKTLGLQMAGFMGDDRVLVINDTTLSRHGEAVDKIEAALSSGRAVIILYVHRPFDEAVRGVIDRALNDGRPVPLDVVASAHFHSQRVLLDLAKRYGADERVTIWVCVNKGGPAQFGIDTPEFLQRNLYNDLDALKARAREILASEYSEAESGRDRQGVRSTNRGRLETVLPGAGRKGIPRELYLKLAGEGSPGSGQAAGDDEVAGPARKLLAIWAALVFVLFSLSGSKLISYILPMYAPCALLAADWCVRTTESSRSARRIAVAILASSGLVFLSVLNYRSVIRLVESMTHKPVRLDSVPPAMIAFIMHAIGMAALASALYWIVLRLRPKLATPALAIGMAGFFGVAIFEGLPAIDSAYLSSVHRLAVVAAKRAEDRNRPLILSSVPRRPSALFYIPDYAFEGGGETQGPVIEPKPDKIAGLLLSRGPAVVLTDSKTAAELVKLDVAAEVESAGGWSIVEPQVARR